MKRELSGIELLRFLCAMTVLIAHYQVFFATGAWHQVDRSGYPLYAVLAPAYERGDWAVQFFWAISGFIFYYRYGRSVSEGKTGAREFAVRRFSRLYPLHFATLVAVAIGQYVYFIGHGTAFVTPDNNAKTFVSQLFFASNWFTSELSFNVQIWSISVEILVYIAFFLIVRNLGFGPAVAIIAAMISWLLLELAPKPFNHSVFECGIYFFFGGLVSLYHKARPALPIAGAAMVLAIVSLLYGIIPMGTKPALALALSCIVVFARTEHALLDRVAFLGNATYSSYLIHFPMQLAMVVAIDAAGISRHLMMNVPALLLYLAFVVACSLIVYRWFEEPMQDYFRRVPAAQLG
ncbi:MAG TPA: acyltransferase [Candidatus Binataceae bacterium]|nr:acyltransferase [Candidatus Binataceae bacterium]